ncbi:OmpA family protein [Pasteurellaceae bacterium USgator11]|nr:OmpA family protein [Pasteurellaceae bacterium USgator41]TNG94087.1 OmpA family protein [Pasteurellaceae bacterium UScroc12]TNG97698.1 OmpA family protein [Pasteurellaceae bacterium UScroc31]TNG99801.1 OmpA family protein [Pasteurellaceae bacterium USgator11]
MKKIATVLVMAWLCNTGVSQAQQTPLFEKWSTYTSPFLNATDLDKNLSQVIFYREAGAINGPAVNVYVDSDYHTSLQENQYKAVSLCAQTHLFSTAFSSSDNRQIKRDKGVYYTIPSQQSSFIKVVSNLNGEPEFQRVEAGIGEQAIRSMPVQKQTLSRVIEPHYCKEKTVLQNFSLSARTLFQTNKGDLAGMYPDGKSEIKELAADLKRLDQRYISHIVISGHSAPGESKATSKKLSAERAKTVLNLLQQEGVHFPMEVMGYSSEQPVAKDCAKRNPSDVKMREACDQANRRVEVTVYSIQ